MSDKHADTHNCPGCGRTAWRDIPVHGRKQYLNWTVRVCPCGRVELYVSGLELGDTLNTAWFAFEDVLKVCWENYV